MGYGEWHWVGEGHLQFHWLSYSYSVRTVECEERSSHLMVSDVHVELPGLSNFNNHKKLYHILISKMPEKLAGLYGYIHFSSYAQSKKQYWQYLVSYFHTLSWCDYS